VTLGLTGAEEESWAAAVKGSFSYHCVSQTTITLILSLSCRVSEYFEYLTEPGTLLSYQ